MDPAELIHRYYATFNRGDREAFLALLTEDVVHDLNQGRSEIGKAAFRHFLERMDRCYAEQVEEVSVFQSQADPHRAAAEFFVRGVYRSKDEGLPPATGQTYRLRVGAFFEISGGRISRITNYYNLEEWLRLIGA